jgi:hypothetical protein
MLLLEFEVFFADIPGKKQISADFMYIEIIQTFEIEQIIADTLWIYETYPIFGFVVKLDARKMRI